MKTNNHWSHYWLAGQLTSLPQDFSENYNGVIKHNWNQSFCRLDKQSYILDICAGNCAIGLLASAYSQKFDMNFNICAIDAADISKKGIQSKFPNIKEHLSQIKIISSCKVEDNQLASNQFDLITSQYGVEYCDWELAAIQVHRLLKKGGQFTMIAHSGSTEIVKYMTAEKLEYECIFNLGIFKLFENHASGKISHEKFIKELRILHKSVGLYFIKTQSNLISSMLLILDNIISMKKVSLQNNIGELDKLCLEYSHAYARLEDLLMVTNAITKKPNWYAVFEQQGLQLTQKIHIMQNGEYNSGILYNFTKE